MNTYGVPWQPPLVEHALLKVLCETLGFRGIVLQKLQETCLPLPVDSFWWVDIPDLIPNFDWDDVWNIKQSSRNADHQQIRFNFIHRTCVTPSTLHSL